MGAPNIFDYATSELSQDAFLCWLIACADCDDAALKNLGLSFIRFLYDPNNTDKHEIKVQGLVKTKDPEKPYPRQQYGKIDVYFQATVNDKIISFVIEDKTDTAMHGDQLKRYAAFVAEDEIEEDDVRLIYFKSGYIYPDEKAAANKEDFVVINLENFIKFLANHENIDNDIFKSYFTYVQKISEDRKEILGKVCGFFGKEEDDYGHEYSHIFRNPYAQYRFMELLDSKLKNTLDDVLGLPKCKFEDIGLKKNRIMRGKSVGGDPWTQFYFYEIPRKDQGSSACEYLFWRLDGWYQLRLRHTGFDIDGSERLVIFRKIFEEVGKPIFNKALRHSTGKRGRERSVGEIQFKSSENSVKNILARMPEFHEKFIGRIRSDQVLSMRL